jgi:hypothetical protein
MRPIVDVEFVDETVSVGHLAKEDRYVDFFEMEIEL